VVTRRTTLKAREDHMTSVFFLHGRETDLLSRASVVNSEQQKAQRDESNEDGHNLTPSWLAGIANRLGAWIEDRANARGDSRKKKSGRCVLLL
jgi:hypothetical protein